MFSNTILKLGGVCVRSHIGRTSARISTRSNIREYSNHIDAQDTPQSSPLPPPPPPPHTPVMIREVIKALQPENGKTYIDMTFGAGGHTTKLLEVAPDARIIALDRDPIAHEYAKEFSEKYPGKIIPLLGRFSELPQLLKSIDVAPSSVDGMLFDFGCSSMQFDTADRGFAINRDGPLDMRMDRGRFVNQPTAADVLAKIEEEDLARILKIYGEEKAAKKIARAIIDVRYSLRSLKTTNELRNVVASCFEEEYRMDSMDRPAHHATKTFQAIRIFVNNELNEISYGIQIAAKYLKLGGRLVTLSFHSLEDTIVKRHVDGNLIEGVVNRVPLKYFSPVVAGDKETIENFRETSWMPMYKHVLTPTEEEIGYNARSRSAKLRGVIRIK